MTSFITLAFLISVADWLYQEFEVVALACSFKNFGYFMGLLRWPGLAFLGTGFIIWASFQGMKGAAELGKGVVAFYLPHMLAIWLVGGYFIYFMLVHDVIPSLSDCHWGIKLFG